MPGRTQVISQVGDSVAVAQVLVSDRTVRSMLMSALPDTLRVGDEIAARTITLSHDGLDVPAVPLWSSTDSLILRVAPNGNIEAVGTGTTRITATVNGLSASHQFNVMSGRKRWGSAFALSLIFPGGGQFYVGHPGRGVFTMLAVGGAVASSLLIKDITVHCGARTSVCTPGNVVRRTEELPYETIGRAAAAAILFLSVVDAVIGTGGRAPLTIATLSDASGGWTADFLPLDGVGSSKQRLRFTLLRLTTGAAR